MTLRIAALHLGVQAQLRRTEGVQGGRRQEHLGLVKWMFFRCSLPSVLVCGENTWGSSVDRADWQARSLCRLSFLSSLSSAVRLKHPGGPSLHCTLDLEVFYISLSNSASFNFCLIPTPHFGYLPFESLSSVFLKNTPITSSGLWVYRLNCQPDKVSPRMCTCLWFCVYVCSIELVLGAQTSSPRKPREELSRDGLAHNEPQ